MMWLHMHIDATAAKTTLISSAKQIVERKLRKMVSRVEEGNEDAAQLLSRVSHSHHSHVATPPKSPVSPCR